MFSETWRKILWRYLGVSLGPFSYGPGLGLVPDVFPRGTRVGAFCSFAEGLRILRRNHPPSRISQHPLFFNRAVGLVSRDTIEAVDENPLTIGNDVWIGMNVIVCPGCRMIGDGAIIAAGAIVTRDVPAYTIVGGNPARTIRRRFAPEVEAAVAASRWWLRPLPELAENLSLFAHDLDAETVGLLTDVFPDAGERPMHESRSGW